ncbi:MAG: hypothetical protein ABSC54_06845 [Smithellaceae bacterium]|jgi:hypothetical protein
MKKLLCVFSCFLFFAAVSSTTLAAERTVQLTIPGCLSCNSNSRIGAILKKIKGVKKYENKGHDILLVTFDDEKTTLSIIINELKRGKFTATGEPIYIK